MRKKISERRITNLSQEEKRLNSVLDEYKLLEIPEGTSLSLYVTLQEFYRIVTDRTLRCFDILFQEDTNAKVYFLGILPDDLASEYQTEIYGSTGEKKSVLKDLEERFLSHIYKRMVFGLDFAQEGDSLDWWRRFPAGQVAVSITFKPKRDWIDKIAIVNDKVSVRANKISANISLKKISYDNLDKLKIGKGLLNHFDFENMRNQFLLNFLADKSPFYKHHKFESEKAVRLFVNSSSHVDDNSNEYEREIKKCVRFTTTDKILPYIELSFCQEEKVDTPDNLPIERITINNCDNKNDVRKSIKFFMETMGYKNIVIKHSNIPFRQ